MEELEVLRGSQFAGYSNDGKVPVLKNLMQDIHEDRKALKDTDLQYIHHVCCVRATYRDDNDNNIVSGMCNTPIKMFSRNKKIGHEIEYQRITWKHVSHPAEDKSQDLILKDRKRKSEETASMVEAGEKFAKRANSGKQSRRGREVTTKTAVTNNDSVHIV